MAPQVSESERYVLYFHESLRGLSVARRHPARVADREVTEISLDFVPEAQGIRTRVEVMTFQYRLLRHMGKTDIITAKAMSREIVKDSAAAGRGERACARNLRAAASSRAAVCRLDYFPDAPKRDRLGKDPPDSRCTRKMENIELQLRACSQSSRRCR